MELGKYLGINIDSDIANHFHIIREIIPQSLVLYSFQHI